MRDDPRAARARELFEQTFHAQAEGVAIAPGRVNLIGEHTDYNLGYVLPMAIDRGVAIAFRRRDDRIVRARSTLTGDTQSVDLDALKAGHRGWMAYVAGVAWALTEAGNEVRGTDLLIHSNLPTGAGLSSSAALEVAAALALGGATLQQASCDTVATIARRAENDFVGVACGVMDQMASACASEGSAMFLDCRSLQMKPVPIPETAAIVVIDTGVRRRLAGTEYNDRRAACGRAVAVLQHRDAGVRSLRDATLGAVEAAREQLGASDSDRARHVVAENERVLDAVAALSRGDLMTAGRLLNESHASLRDLYEVSSAELDAAVAAAVAQSGCLGARMTGAGFGGCAVALVERQRANAIIGELPYSAFIAAPAAAAHVLMAS